MILSTNSSYQRICELLAKMPPMTFEMTPLEMFLIAEVLLKSVAIFPGCNIGVKKFLKRLIASLGVRCNSRTNSIITTLMIHSNLEEKL